MKKLYLVVFSAAVPRDAVIRTIESTSGMGVWFYSMANSLFVYSTLSAQLVYDQLKKAIPVDERFFVTEVNKDNSQGWLPSKHWDIITWGGADIKLELDFHGYYRKSEFLWAKPGIYCVYRGVYNQNNDTVSLRELLYIGQSQNVKERHGNHENINEWRQKLRPGEELQYSMAILSVDALERCEAALIYKNKPPCNHTGVESFSYPPTLLEIKGRTAFLEGGLIEQS